MYIPWTSHANRINPISVLHWGSKQVGTYAGKDWSGRARVPEREQTIGGYTSVMAGCRGETVKPSGWFWGFCSPILGYILGNFQYFSHEKPSGTQKMGADEEENVLPFIHVDPLLGFSFEGVSTWNWCYRFFLWLRQLDPLGFNRLATKANTKPAVKIGLNQQV